MWDQFGSVAGLDKRYRSCSGCCHVKHGCFVLGLVELLATIIMLAVVINRLHSAPPEDCGESSESCSEFSASATLVGDYIATTLLAFWLLAIICLFYALFNRWAEFLVPHLVLQAGTFLFSVTYFILFAWDYFYVHLYVDGRPFRWVLFWERIWVIFMFLLLAGGEIYIFCVIIACYRYLKDFRRRSPRNDAPSDI